MRTIWKYEVPLLERFAITMPSGAEVLALQRQNGDFFLWARVDPSAPMVARRFRTVGTGQPVPPDAARHVGTYQTVGGQFVWHVFEAGTGRWEDDE